jgi:hypothetical protein
MKSRVLLKVQAGALAAAVCVYAGLYLYTSHRYASAFADARLGDGSDGVIRLFGVPSTYIESPHHSDFSGFTMLPCRRPVMSD